MAAEAAKDKIEVVEEEARPVIEEVDTVVKVEEVAQVVGRCMHLDKAKAIISSNKSIMMITMARNNTNRKILTSNHIKSQFNSSNNNSNSSINQNIRLNPSNKKKLLSTEK